MSLMPRENGIEPKIGLGQHSPITALDQPNDKVSIYLFKINNGNTRKITRMTSEQCQWRRSGEPIVNYNHISHIEQVNVLLGRDHLPKSWSKRDYLLMIH